jgi:hypothetical protein
MSRGIEDHFWIPERLWEGQTAILLGGGDSLREFDLERLRGINAKVMAINALELRAPWSAAWYFTDNNIFEWWRPRIEAFEGLVITASRIAKRELPEKIRRVQLEPDNKPVRFMPPGCPTITHGRSSGHLAISVSVALGAARVLLLGFDMRVVDGRSNSHDEYRKRRAIGYGDTDPAVYTDEFLPAFAGWQRAAEQAGVAIRNCTPGSMLLEFPMSTIEVELARLGAAPSQAA